MATPGGMPTVNKWSSHADVVAHSLTTVGTFTHPQLGLCTVYFCAADNAVVIKTPN